MTVRLFDAKDRKAAPPPPTVRVNGREISRVTITREIQNHPAETPAQARDEAVQALVVRELLLHEAARRELIAMPQDLGDGQRETDDDALIRQLLDDALKLPVPTDAECHRFYETNKSHFESSPIWEAAHILLSSAATDRKARAAAREAACEMIDLLRENPDQFDNMARSHSDCTSREQGGNLGQITTGQTTPAFEAALDAMEPGTISKTPVETPYGIHIIRLDRCVLSRTLPFEMVRDKIADYLADAVFRRAVSQFVALLAGQAKIEGVEFDGALSPLVQ